MSLGVFAAVCFAALLHAIWNALLKRPIRSTDLAQAPEEQASTQKYFAILAMVLGSLPVCVLVLVIQPLPSVKIWPYVLLSTLLHVLYQITLSMAYSKGSFASVYPIARGTAPIWVTLVGVLFLGESLVALSMAGIALIIIGLLVLALPTTIRSSNQSSTAALRDARQGIYFALLTGIFIAAYVLVDAIGAKQSGTPLVFFALVSLLNAPILAWYVEQRHMGLTRAVLTQGKVQALLSGNFAFAAYGIVLWAFTLAPVPAVSALRETSVIFALIIARLWFGERLSPSKVIAIGLALLGMVCLRLA